LECKFILQKYSFLFVNIIHQLIITHQHQENCFTVTIVDSYYNQAWYMINLIFHNFSGLVCGSKEIIRFHNTHEQTPHGVGVGAGVELQPQVPAAATAIRALLQAPPLKR
jgi:hypothetical protein